MDMGFDESGNDKPAAEVFLVGLGIDARRDLDNAAAAMPISAICGSLRRYGHYAG